MRKQSGLSLIELMIAITLGLVLMTGVIQVFLSSRVTFSTQQAMSRIQETGRLAIEFIARDVRMAGYMGCASGSESALVVDSAGAQGGLHRDFTIGLQGFSSVDENVLSPAPLAANDILVIRTADAQPLFLNAGNAVNTLSVQVPEASVVNNCHSGICTGKVVAVSDCVDTRVFVVQGIAASGSTLTLNNVPVPAGNFGAGAELIPVKTYAYYVAPSTADASRPSLWQSVDGAAAQELFDGVEAMRLSYGTSGSTNYVDAGSITNWSVVHGVKVEMLVASVQDNVLNEPQIYSFNGNDNITAPDRRLRQVFVNTIGVRSNLK